MKIASQQLFLNAVLAFFAVGIYAGTARLMPIPIVWLLSLGAMLLVFISYSIRKQQKGIIWGFCLLFFLLGCGRGAQSLVLPPDDISFFAEQRVQVQGSIKEAPQERKMEDGIISVRYIIEAKSVIVAGKEKVVSGRAYLYSQRQAGGAAGRIGDEIEAAVEVRALHTYQNPGRIDAVAAAARQGIHARLMAGKQEIRIDVRETAAFLRWVARVRQDILLAMEHVMPAADAAALFAMLFGGYDGIKPELLAAFTTTGIVHILSVSGSHITLLAGTLTWICGIFRFSRSMTAFLVAAVIIVYAVFAGCTPPVVRSALMGICAFTALAVGRKSEATRLLTITALLLLALQPELLADISFQLSFAATAGLLYLSPCLQDHFVILPKWLAANLAVTIGAQLAVIPLLAWYFNALSLSSLLANLVAVPIVEYMIVAGLLAVVIGQLAAGLQTLLFVLCSLMIGMVYTLTKMIAALPGASVYLPPMVPEAGVLYYGILFLLLDREGAKLFWPQVIRWQRPLLAGLFAGLVVYSCQRLQEQPLQVHFIDVGQGDAALLITPHHQAVMIDTGGSRQGDFDIGERVVTPYLRHYGVHRLNFLLLTHAHEDHAGGTAGVLRHIPVRHVLIGRESRQEYARTTKLNFSLEPAAAFAPAYPGEQFAVDGVDFEILQSPETTPGGSGNETSTVIRATYKGYSFLFTGDLTASGEKALLESGQKIRSDVLKVGHHGSKGASSPEFLQAVHPAWAVISVGADNSFGHPHAETLQRIEGAGAALLRTDKDGAVVFECDGRKLFVRTFAGS